MMVMMLRRLCVFTDHVLLTIVCVQRSKTWKRVVDDGDNSVNVISKRGCLGVSESFRMWKTRFNRIQKRVI